MINLNPILFKNFFINFSLYKIKCPVQNVNFLNSLSSGNEIKKSFELGISKIILPFFLKFFLSFLIFHLDSLNAQKHETKKHSQNSFCINLSLLQD